MSKYIIRNCPCYWHIGEDDGCSLENMKSCEDDTSCVVKQIVEKCVNEINYSDRWSESRAFAKELLDIITIQEVE